MNLNLCMCLINKPGGLYIASEEKFLRPAVTK